MEQQPSSKVRFVALAATAIALLAISMPFVWQHDVVEAERVADDGAALVSSMAPVASHDESAIADEDPAGACKADAKPANMDFVLKDLDGKDVKIAPSRGK